MSNEQKETRNHVVRTNEMYGHWGRGNNLQEAMNNARVKFGDGTPFSYYHFADDTWDITTDGSLKYHGDKVLHSEDFENKKS